MAAKTITMHQTRRIIQLFNNGESKRSIARQCGLSRNTLKDYLRIIEKTALSNDELLSLNDDELGRIIHDPVRHAPDNDDRHSVLES